MSSAAAAQDAALLERLAAAYAIPYRAGATPAPRQMRTPAGFKLNLIDWGGTGEPVLLLHGGALTAHCGRRSGPSMPLEKGLHHA